MAELTSVSYEQELHELEYLLWGPEVRPDIFKRWSQGIVIKHTHCIGCGFKTNMCLCLQVSILVIVRKVRYNKMKGAHVLLLLPYKHLS